MIELSSKNKELYNQLRKLMIQKRKVIQMRLEINRLEGQLRREKNIREIQGKTSSLQNGALLKKLRDTAKKEQIERQMFLEEFSSRDWKHIIANSPDRVINIFFGINIYLIFFL